MHSILVSCCGTLLVLLNFSHSTKWYPNVNLPNTNAIKTDHKFTILTEDDEFVIKSPNHPKAYPPNSNESYYINGSGYPIQITFVAFALQGPDKYNQCTRDRLAVWDLKYPYNILLLACGSNRTDVTSYSDQLALLFLSDRSQEFSGFELRITRAECGYADLWCPSDPDICVPNERICDGVPDCPDEEDEICSSTCGTPAITPSANPVRIVGGVTAVANSWPWQVYVSLTNTYCGAAVIGPQWVMTASHCCVKDGVVRKAEDFTLYMGFTKCWPVIDADGVTVKTVYAHPKHRTLQAGVVYDFCLLELDEYDHTRHQNSGALYELFWFEPEELVKQSFSRAELLSDTFPTTSVKTINLPLSWSKQVSPICLPRPYEETTAGGICVATGCGYTNPSNATGPKPKGVYARDLQQVDLSVVDPFVCALSYLQMMPEMSCATGPGKDTCQGDSGGPLACRMPGPDGSPSQQWQLSAVTSFGLGCASGTPGVYASIRFALPHLIEVLYARNRAGWFDDTSVPLVDHLRSGTIPFAVKKSNRTTTTVTNMAVRDHAVHFPYSVVLLFLITFKL